MLKKLNKKLIFVFFCITVLVVITSIVSWAVRSTPTEPIGNIIIESNNYDNEGSFKLEESSKWTSNSTANVSFDLSTVPQLDGKNKDVVLIMDTSTPYLNADFDTEKNTINSVIDYILDNTNNRIALISYNSTSEIISNFTNNKSNLLSSLEEVTFSGNSSYTAALLNLESLLNSYEQSNDRDLNVVFFTYRYPNADDNNRIAIYEKLKQKYSYMNINGVQLRLDLHQPLIDITDKQWLATDTTLYNYLLEASLDTLKYEKFEVSYYVDSNFTVTNNDINVSIGTINLTEDDGKQVIVWNIDNNLITGEIGNMTVNLTLKNEFINVSGLYTTNDHVNIKAKVISKSLQEKESDRTPVLKNYYTVSYDPNTPSGCTLSSINSEEHAVYTNVTKNQTNLSCDGYIFNGWQTNNENVVDINDDTFMMPEGNVTFKAIWSKPAISKSMNGTIHEKSTLYKKVKNDYLNDNYGYLYSGEGSSNYLNSVYYYSKDDSDINSNVIFANMCFRMVRTTESGGVKLIYNGIAENGTCGTNRSASIGFTGYSIESLASDYYYGTDYIYDEDNDTFRLSGTITHGSWNDTNYNDYLSKYTCLSDTKSGTCQTLYYVNEYNSSSSANCFLLDMNTNYNTIGSINSNDNSLAYLGYMYNTIYESNLELMSPNILEMLLVHEINSDDYYGDSITNSMLDNPFKVTNDDYSTIVGKYTFFNEDSSHESEDAYYIVGVDDNKIYYINAFNNTNPRYDNREYKFADNVTDNGNGTYTLSGNILTTSLTDWLTNYSSVVGKYTCGSNSLTCESPYYVTNSTKSNINYYSLDKNYKYGNSYSYDSNTGLYTLTNTVNFYDVNDNYTDLENHHYTCFNTSGTCSTISYIYEYDDNTVYYININGGKSISDATNEMLSANDVNTKSSTFKKAIDLWYENNLSDYSNYLEDTVFCNDRSISSLGSWDKDSNIIKYDSSNNTGNLQFSKYGIINSNSISLNCPANDKFSVSNTIGNGKLTYPVGLLSVEEAKLSKGLLTNTGDTLLMSPSYYLKNKAYSMKELNNNISATGINYASLRPVISIKANIEFLYGNGSYDHPYVITEN